MKRVFSVVLFVITLNLFCGGQKSSLEYSEKFARTMCGKMNQCMEEHMSKMDAQEKEMARKMMPIQNCDKIAERVVNEEKQEGPVNLTAEEVSLADECLEYLESASCSGFGKDPMQSHNACSKFSNIMSKKERTGKM